MPTLADVLTKEDEAKAEMDTIAAGVVSLNAGVQTLKDQLAAAVANQNDPAQIQAALDKATALADEGAAVVASLPKAP